jgi:hypothetical protein
MRYAILCFLFGASFCWAEEPCPWLNAATAAGILNGKVTSHVASGVCVFRHDTSELRIGVETVNLPYKPGCEPNPTFLKAIGNEAFACSVEEKKGNISEQVAGRVRDHAFSVRLTSNDIPRIALRERARQVAEQVAGILF